jgi:hypothetical protein
VKPFNGQYQAVKGMRVMGLMDVGEFRRDMAKRHKMRTIRAWALIAVGGGIMLAVMLSPWDWPNW